jgi:hypothetical protein
MDFYDFKRHWTRRIAPHLTRPEFTDVLVRDFNRFTFGRWGTPFVLGDVPAKFETCDWNLWHRGREPRYWAYVKHSACHWLANSNLALAKLSEPKRAWRIVTSDQHSTVWDGDTVLFDMNGAALMSVEQAFGMASDGPNAHKLAIGEELVVEDAEHYSVQHPHAPRVVQDAAGVIPSTLVQAWLDKPGQPYDRATLLRIARLYASGVKAEMLDGMLDEFVACH